MSLAIVLRFWKFNVFDMVIAISGAWLGGLLGMNRILDGLLGSIVSATLGALVILWVYNKWFKK